MCFQSAITPTIFHTAGRGHNRFVRHNADGALNLALRKTLSSVIGHSQKSQFDFSVKLREGWFQKDCIRRAKLEALQTSSYTHLGVLPIRHYTIVVRKIITTKNIVVGGLRARYIRP